MRYPHVTWFARLRCAERHARVDSQSSYMQGRLFSIHATNKCWVDLSLTYSRIMSPGIHIRLISTSINSLQKSTDPLSSVRPSAVVCYWTCCSPPTRLVIAPQRLFNYRGRRSLGRMSKECLAGCVWERVDVTCFSDTSSLVRVHCCSSFAETDRTGFPEVSSESTWRSHGDLRMPRLPV